MAVVALGALLLVAGCVGTDAGDQPADTDASSTEPAPRETDAGAAGSEDAGPASGNDTRTENGSAPRQDAPPLGDLTMDDATTTRANATTVVFHWNETFPAEAATVSTAFDIPEGAAFHVDAELAWAGNDSGLGLRVVSPGTLYICQARALTPSTGLRTCSATALAREDADRWTVRVDRGPVEAGPEVPFTLTLTLRSLAPDTVPPAASLTSGEPAPEETTDPGWPKPDEATVRPGVKIGGSKCTASFVFATPDNATLYIATASHCFPGWDVGDPVAIGFWSVEGTLAYCSWGAQEDLVTCPEKRFGEDEGYRQDLALVEIPQEARQDVHPAMLVWGGPTELGSAPTQGERLLTYGNSERRDGATGAINALDSRPGVVLESQEGTTVATFPSPVIEGDSGGPVQTEEGATVGLLSFTDSDGGIPRGAAIGISNLAPALQELEEQTGRSVELATWPLFDPPRAELLENGFPGS